MKIIMFYNICNYHLSFIYVNNVNLSIILLGVLACLDGYMNIALEQTEEYVNGQLKNKYGDAFIRGNNGDFYLDFFRNFFILICIYIYYL